MKFLFPWMKHSHEMYNNKRERLMSSINCNFESSNDVPQLKKNFKDSNYSLVKLITIKIYFLLENKIFIKRSSKISNGLKYQFAGNNLEFESKINFIMHFTFYFKIK